MSCFICPVCKAPLSREANTYRCSVNHCFDISKYGYVNLLMSQQSSKKRHGDDSLMVVARRSFLQKGYYKPLRDALCECVKSNVSGCSVIADIGCGEGYYSSAIAESTETLLCGIDISKDALRYASKELKNSEFAVASAFDLPFAEGSVDCVLNVFAPSAYEEFHRILKNDGVLIKAVPLSEHLWGLKCALYDKPYPNKPELRDEELFELVFFEEIKYEITLTDSDDIQNLFKMTPYYYKTGRNEAERLLNFKNLTTTVHFGVEVYRKR